jgi:hypothetical protein
MIDLAIDTHHELHGAASEPKGQWFGQPEIASAHGTIDRPFGAPR